MNQLITMTLKVLLLNFPEKDITKRHSNITVIQSTVEKRPTLHDFHAILIDTDEMVSRQWWPTNQGGITYSNDSEEAFGNFSNKIKEQMETGGIVFCLSNSVKTLTKFGFSTIGRVLSLRSIMSYFFCPIDLGVVNENGDTFYPKSEELRYFAPLIKQIPKQDIDWTCYFSKIPEKTRIIGVNRAGYAVFIEVPVGRGKLVMLPHFKNRSQAATIVVSEIIPRMIIEEEFAFAPQWVSSYMIPFENSLRETLSEIEKAKRLLYTRDMALKKAVAFAFEKIGFEVEILPDGTLPDLRLRDKELSFVVEVKGHENKQGVREDVLQVMGYMSETDVKEKGVVVVDHQFNEEPSKRNAKAFTDGAVQLAEKVDVSLISSVELSDIVMQVLERKLEAPALEEIRCNIMEGKGIVKLI